MYRQHLISSKLLGQFNHIKKRKYCGLGNLCSVKCLLILMAKTTGCSSTTNTYYIKINRSFVIPTTGYTTDTCNVNCNMYDTIYSIR